MIEYLKETGSTNADLVERLIRDGRIPEGFWLVADRQTAGRGRQGREWFDGQGNFMGSTVVHLSPSDPPVASLALVAGLALFETVRWHAPASAELLLKWPNDLLAGKAKLAGILLERHGDAIVAGFGVNLVFAPDIPGRQTTSLRALGAEAARDIFAEDLSRHFALELDRWRLGGAAPVIRRWLDHGHERGARLRVSEPGGGMVDGAFDGLDEDGALRLRLPDGTVRAIHAGDVIVDGNG